jgi:hypothetical protein
MMGGMSDNPYESPNTQAATRRTHRRIKLNAFDKFCAAIAFVMGLLLLVMGAFGVFFGCYAYIKSPPVLGAFPAFAGWGIIRAVYVAWKMTNRPDAIEEGAGTLINGDLPPGPNAT